jgi:hypothetical protein
MPRLYEADQRALGRRHRHDEFALGMLAVDLSSGPAKPSGICATPVKFSMLPLRMCGSKE